MQISLKNVKNTEKYMFTSTCISNVHMYTHIMNMYICVYLKTRKERANGTEGISENSHQQFSVSL